MFLKGYKGELVIFTRLVDLAKASDLLMDTSNKDRFDVPIRRSEKLAYRKIVREKISHPDIKVAISHSTALEMARL